MSGRRPPFRRCATPGCGALVASWSTGPVACRDCARPHRENSAELAGELAARRQERIDQLTPAAPVPYNQFPEGF